jgi:hypothetical protein
MESKIPQNCDKIGATNLPALSIFLGFFVYAAYRAEMTHIETIQFGFQFGTRFQGWSCEFDDEPHLFLRAFRPPAEPGNFAYARGLMEWHPGQPHQPEP